MRRVRALVAREDDRLCVAGAPLSQVTSTEWMAQPGEIDDVSARSLEHALERLRERDFRDYGPPARHGLNPATGRAIEIRLDPRSYDVCLAEHEFYDSDEVIRERVRFALQEAGLRVRVELPWDEGDPPAQGPGDVERLVKPLCDGLGVPFRVTCEGSMTGQLELELAPRVLRRSLGELAALGSQVDQLLMAAVSGAVTPETARELVRGGFASALIGQSETSWLEAKGTPAKKDLEFAKDVAAFANTGRAGIIVYGFSNRHGRNGDQIAGVRPFHAKAMSPQSLHDFLVRTLRPRPIGIEIEVIELGADQFVGYVFVAAQEDSRLPVMFSGVQVEGKLRESFVGIPVRLGERTYWEDATTLHSLIAAGRAVLAGERQRNS